MFVGRYLIMVLPMLAVFMAWTIVTIRPVLARAGVAVGLAVLLAFAIPSAYADGHQQDWRSAGRWMAGAVRAGDAMIAQNGRRSLEYYLGRSGAPVIPRSTRVALALDDPQLERVWVAVLGDLLPGYDPEIPQRLGVRYEVTASRTFGPRLTILLMTQRPAGEVAG
jgi:hypothetical protein